MPPQTPNRFFDLIMKGGITSGIVYPPAICRIAEAGYLHGIGGTSAGAIGACFAAAAEYHRRTHLKTPKMMGGYDKLEQLPNQLGESGRLLSLFAPDKPTKPLFDKIKQESGLIESNWLASAWRRRTSIPRYGWYFFRRNKLLKPLTDNHMGLCTGMANGMPNDPDAPALMPWLHRQLNTVAGLDPEGPPLTFGQLWGARVPTELEAQLGSISTGIDLKMVTTCLTFGKPYTLPLTDKRFLFKAEELGRYFPEKVNTYLINKAESYNSNYAKEVGLLPLPAGGDMPVIVAMRMSLSFPLLFSLVPLWTRSAEIDPVKQPAVRTYFLDGGVTSNLPMHFFDAPLPRWPTLAINLQYRREDYRTERNPKHFIGDGLFIPQHNNQAIDPLYHQVDVGDKTLAELLNYRKKQHCDESDKQFKKRKKNLDKRIKNRSEAQARLGGLANSIFRAAQTWNDMSYVTLPGYRQRVAEQWLEPNEGGMNLNMPDCVIQQLVAKGRNIGAELVKQFDPQNTSGDPMTWEDHRWVRMRGSIAALAKLLHDVHRGLNHQLLPDADYRSLIKGAKAPDGSWQTLQGIDRRSYSMTSQTQLIDAVTMLDEIESLANKLSVMIGTHKNGEDPRTKPFSQGPMPGLQFQLRAAEPYHKTLIRSSQGSNDAGPDDNSRADHTSQDQPNGDR